jgi:acetyl esterase/lipase
VRCAVRWLRTRADSLRVDPSRVAAFGYSAGAHLASLLGVSADAAELDDPACAGGPSAAVQAVIASAGPQDFRLSSPYNHSYTREQARLVTNFLGVFPGDAPALAAAASPITHVGPGDPPFLLVQGGRDGLVRPVQSRAMHAALRAAGVPSTLLELRGVGHRFIGLDAREEPQGGCTMLAFLRQRLGAPP